MAFLHLIRLLLCFLTVLAVTGDDDSNDIHVIIGPVENITTYLNGSTNIVVTWDPPPVYLIHDVFGKFNYSMDYMVVTKHSGSALNESISSPIVSEDPVGPNQNNLTQNGTSAAAIVSLATSNITCRPISFFDNFTIDIIEDKDKSGKKTFVASKDSIKQFPLQTIVLKENQYAVVFSNGCITNYVVSWGEADINSTASFNMTVLPTASTANITDLKPATRYWVVVAAVYVSGVKIDSKPPVNFTTRNVDEPKGCQCDMYGAIAPGQGCNMTGTTYCKCKPGYQGSFCEVCSPGYYRTAPHHQCHRCPCDNYSGNKLLLTPCQFVEGFLRCDSCETGYIGSICQQCSHGFYRVNGRCAVCFCTGNSSPTTSKKCMDMIGACLDCQHNTTGFHCERCLPGYIGDPILYKNCTLADEVRGKAVSSISLGVVAAIVITFLLTILLVVAGLLFKRYHSKAKLRAFWTIEMKKDNDDVDFCSVHNDDARLDDVEDADHFSKHGLSSSSNKYSRLQDEI